MTELVDLLIFDAERSGRASRAAKLKAILRRSRSSRPASGSLPTTGRDHGKSDGPPVTIAGPRVILEQW